MKGENVNVKIIRSRSSLLLLFFSVLWLVAVSNVTHVADVTGFLCSVVNTYLSCCNGI